MMKLSPLRGLLSLSLVLTGLGFAAAEASAQDNEVAKNTGNATVFTPTRWSSPAPATGLARVGVQTAQPVPLTLDDAIRRSLANNNDVEVSRDDVRFQETQIRALQGFYDPVFSVSPTFTHNSSTGSTATNDFRLNPGLNKFFERGGGNIQSFFNNNRTENAFAQQQVTAGSVSGSTGAIYSSSLGVIYTQPLLRNFSIDSRRQAIRVAKRRLEQTDTDFRLQATTTITSTQRAYWEFVFALRNQQNQVANVNFAKENLRQIEARIEAGAAAPLERAEVATELANREGDLLLATQQVSVAENSLKQLIIREPLSSEWTQTFVPTDQPAFSLQSANLDDAMKDAMDNRFELRRLRLQQDINKIDIQYFKNQTKPQIDLNSSFSLNGLSRGGTNLAVTSPLVQSSSDLFLLNAINSTRTSLGLPPITNTSVTIPPASSFLFGGFNRSLANIFRADAPNYSVGVTISFPFHNRTAKANLEGARIQEHQIDAQLRSQEQVVIVEVRNAVQSVETARQRVLTARSARQNAEIQLEGERKLYEAGRSTTFLLFQRENALTNARNAEIRAETDYNKAVADLQRTTSTAFRANNITVDSPVPIK